MHLQSLVFATAVACIAIAGCAEPAPIEPVCEHPAPITGQSDPRAPDYLVGLRDGIDTQAEATRLASVYRLENVRVLSGSSMFAAAIDDDAREKLRCEPSVSFIAHDGIVGPVDVPGPTSTAISG